MPKVSSPGYKQLTEAVGSILLQNITVSEFTYKGKIYTLASGSLLVKVHEKCQGLMAEVELTEGEESFLASHAERGPNTVIEKIAERIAACIDLKVDDGSLPTEENVKLYGLTGLFFNAMIYGPAIDLARLTPASLSAGQKVPQPGGFATVDILKPLRVKDVARHVHEAIAAMMTLEDARSLLLTLSTVIAGPAAQQLRVEYGANGLYSPVAFLKSYVSKSQPPVTGDTRTWQNTVLAISARVREKYTAEVTTIETQELPIRIAAFNNLKQLYGALATVFEQQISGKEDAAFDAKCFRERVALRLLSGAAGQRAVDLARLVSSNDDDNSHQPH